MFWRESIIKLGKRKNRRCKIALASTWGSALFLCLRDCKAGLRHGWLKKGPVTGLIVAGALIRPEKKLEVLDVPFLVNRFHEKSFARGARREVIASCTEMGLTLEEFLGIALEAMKEIDQELGL